MKIDTKEILENSVNFSILLQDKLAKSNLQHHKQIVFHSSNFRNSPTLKSHSNELEKSEIPIIYIIRVKDKNTAKVLIEKFLRFSKENKLKVKNVDRVNVSRFNGEKSNVLYVGSSTTDFVTRIKNHLGVLKNRVYSLHLSKWDENFNYEIVIDIFKVKSLDKNEVIERFVVEIIEQQIWEKLQPIFGKKSGL
ncbi:hypothetical protein DOS84_14690 [Flavobacterium aquariorum]|uniref:GIY-YIG domain-containing protein n=1 Tax=Flavobacterium aquariorum TaxID=2217670 RepID=A0A2W7U627_9FLAO|nr:hypothetical protein [Flavobacterium aquariorum]PZX92699.1 hypothetical protein DOS84_14690 [Flavobacterium aquariorum]